MPLDLAHAISIDGAFIIEVDTEWNGLNYYCFAPEEADDEDDEDDEE